MSEPLDLDGIEARANAAAQHLSGRRWVVDETSAGVVDVRANLGAGPTVVTTIPLGVEIRRDNAEHIAGMDPATTLALVAEVRALRAKVEAVRALGKEWYAAGDGPYGAPLLDILDGPVFDDEPVS